MSDFDAEDQDANQIDTLLRVALANRPEPATNEDFATRVLAVARPAVVPMPQCVVSAWPVWAAVIAVAAIVCIGILRLMDLSAITSSDTSLTNTVSADSVSLLPIGGAVFLIAVAWAVGRAAFSSPEPGLIATST